MSSLSISKAWDESVAFINREVRLVFPLALAFFMLPSVIMGWAQPAGSTSEGGIGGLSILLLMLLVMIGQIAIARLSVGWTGSIGGVITRAASRIWAYLAASITAYVPLFLVAMIVVTMIMGANGMTDLAKITPQQVAAMPSVAITIFVAALVAVAIATRILPMVAVAGAEDVGPLKLLKRSFALTRGHFFRLFGVLILVGATTLLIDWAAQAVGGTLAALSLGAPEPFNLSALIIALLQGFVGAAASAIAAILIGRIYAQLATQLTVPDVEQG
nr:hypothetical protein [uncultured Sphingomonas sp.]